MAFKFNEASSSDYPPDKKTTPTKAAGIVLDKAKTVLVAISAGVAFFLSGWLVPGVTIFGFNNPPSQKNLLSLRHLVTTVNTLSVTFWEVSIS